MSTRANVELQTTDGESVLLYHHWDGYPRWIVPEIERLLAIIAERLSEPGCLSWWDSERVGALMVYLSKREADLVPGFQPSSGIHGDIEYYYVVLLGPEFGWYQISCYELEFSGRRHLVAKTEHRHICETEHRICETEHPEQREGDIYGTDQIPRTS